jgi:hypothetical protein
MGGWGSGKRWSSRAQRPIENSVGRVQRPKAQQQTTGERYKSPIQGGKCHSCMQHTHDLLLLRRYRHTLSGSTGCVK